MATMTRVLKNDQHYYVVVHPLDDKPEEKIDTSALGRMPMTRAAKLSLLSLRVYLLVMLGLVAFRVWQAAAGGH
jgi:hypothetical protein